MIGRSVAQDRAFPAYDAQDKFGASTQYALRVQRPYDLTPRAELPYWATLHASNKVAEHNIANGPRFIPVAQLANQTRPPNLRNLISHRAFLRPGSQSLGGT